MKKIATLFLLSLSFFISGPGVFAQGLEDFTNFPETANAYHSGTFAGNDGSTWNYVSCRGDSVITAPTPTLAKGKTPAAEITSGSIAGGMGTLSFDFKQVFSTSVSLNVLVNGVLVTTVTTSGEQYIVKNSGPIVVNQPGTIILDFIQSSATAGQVAIDNITWDAFGGGIPDPEPTNYPTAFAVSGKGLNMLATWTDATGTQVPAGYLVKISKTDNITVPVDATYTPDDIDLTDGVGSKNVAQGIQHYTFSGLDASTTYYLKIFPFTNAGSLVNYKTDGTAPSANANTQAIKHKQDFESNGLAPWTQFSVLGDQVWDTLIISGNIFASMSGYVAGAGVPNEDWLISPSIALPAGSTPTLQFSSSMNYGTGTNGIMLQLSTNYTSGDPTTNGDWNDVTNLATFSTGAWAWTNSGIIDLTGYEGDNFHLAFTYTNAETNVPTWEIDNVVIAVNSGIGFADPSKAVQQTSIYPNPCTDAFAVKIPAAKSYKVTVYNAQGTMMSENEVNQPGTLIQTSNLASGIYMVSAQNLDTNVKEMHKLIVR